MTNPSATALADAGRYAAGDEAMKQIAIAVVVTMLVTVAVKAGARKFAPGVAAYL